MTGNIKTDLRKTGCEEIGQNEVANTRVKRRVIYEY
jgi:hypothetical protein